MLLKIITNDPGEDPQIQLEPGLTVTIGTSEDNTICLTGATGVERTHCVIKPTKQGGYGIKDLGTPQGTQLNGKPITVARLNPDDRIQVGNVTLHCLADTPPPQETAPSPAQPAADKKEQHGLPPRDIDLDRIDTEIAGYKLLEYLGRGSMGTVYRATQISLQREVALKIMRRELTRSSSFVEKFATEARAAARFNHPNVVHIYDVGGETGLYYLSMELMDAGSVENEIEKKGKLTLDEAIKVISQAARGLGYAQKIGVVHRDIKPDNLMRNSHGVVKIADLGLASTSEKQASEPSKGEREIFGTPHFISPEQARGQDVDIRSDIYSLGCTFYRLVTGRTPFQGNTVKEIIKQQLTATAEPAHKVAEDLPESVSRIIQKMMAKDPAERTQNPDELLTELDSISTSSRRLPLWIGIIAIVALVVVIAINFSGPPKGKPNNNGNSLPVSNGNNKEIRELKADKAFLQAQSKNVSDQEMVKLLDTVIKSFPGTNAASRAREVAKKLRRKINEQINLEKNRVALVKEVLGALAKARQSANGDGMILFNAIAQIPNLQKFNGNEKIAAATAAGLSEAEKFLNQKLELQTSQCSKALSTGKKSRLVEITKIFNRTVDDQRIPLACRQRLEKKWRPLFKNLEQKAQALISQKTASQLVHDHRLWQQMIFKGPDCAWKRLRQLDLEGALTRIKKVAPSVVTSAYQKKTTRLTTLFTAAMRACQALRRDLSKGGNPVQVGNTVWRIESFAPPGQIHLSSGNNETKKAKHLRLDQVLSRAETQWLAALAHPQRRQLKDQGELTDLAALLCLVGTARVADIYQTLLKPLSSGSGNQKLDTTSLDLPLYLLELCQESLTLAGTGGNREIAAIAQQEKQAAMLLNQAMHMFALNRNLEANQLLSQLIDRSRETAIFNLFSQRNALDPTHQKK